jgi:hypothetical protein
MTLIAHDLRSPLTNMEGLLPFAKWGFDPEFNSRLIDNAITSVELKIH